MSRTRSVVGRLTAAVLVAGLIGCALPQGRAPQVGPADALAPDAFLARVASCEVIVDQQRAMEIPRMEDLPPHEWLTYGYMPPAAHER